MKKAGELLSAFFDEGLIRSAKGYSDFFSSWKSIVGDRLGAHSRIVELEKSVLLVEADHPGWIQLIQMNRSSILESIHKRFPELPVTAISIKLSSANSVVNSNSPRLSPEDRTGKEEAITAEEPPAEEKCRDPYTNISDESFKDLLRRLEQSIKKGSR